MLFFQTKSDGFLKFVSQLSDDNRGPLKNLQNRTHTALKLVHNMQKTLVKLTFSLLNNFFRKLPRWFQEIFVKRVNYVCNVNLFGNFLQNSTEFM